MARRQAYKEHFHYSDPLSSASRTTRYRILKRLRLDQSEDDAPTEIPELAAFTADSVTGAATETTVEFSSNAMDDSVAVGTSSASAHTSETNMDDIAEEGSDSDVYG